MAGIGEKTLKNQSFRAEGRACLTQRTFDIRHQRRLGSDQPLAASAAAADRFQQYGKAHAQNFRANDVGVRSGTFASRNDGNIRGNCRLLGARLVAEPFQCFGGRTDKNHSGGLHGTGKLRIFGQKAMR